MISLTDSLFHMTMHDCMSLLASVPRYVLSQFDPVILQETNIYLVELKLSGNLSWKPTQHNFHIY
jgi:hypothetical protein